MIIIIKIIFLVIQPPDTLFFIRSDLLDINIWRKEKGEEEGRE
jgi:hypothetical protein